MKSFLKIIVLFFLPVWVTAQGGLVGVVRDAVTKERIDGATIYINNTQLATSSNARGVFQFSRIPVRDAALVISHASYRKLQLDLPSRTDTLYIDLQPRTDVLEDVVVKTKLKDNWKKWGFLFTQNFIGPGDVEKQCRILNPEVLHFYYDRSASLLKAWARKPIRVQNDLLGYIVNVDLDQFTYSFADGVFAYAITSYYQPPPNALPVQRFAANRLRVYDGSRLQFMRSVYRRSFEGTGFRLYRYRSQVDAERERVQSVLLKRRGELNAGTTTDAVNTISTDLNGKDSAKYYASVLSQAAYILRDTSLLKIGERSRPLNDSLVFFSFGKDSFLLSHEPPVTAYDDRIRKWSRHIVDRPGDDAFQSFTGTGYQKHFSLLYLRSDSGLVVRPNGLVVNANALMLEGYLSNRRIAYDLPWDYDPRRDEALLDGRTILEQPSLTDKLVQSLEKISTDHQSSSLYLHLDKSIYDHNENIWFSAYLVRPAVDTAVHHTVYVSLVDQRSQKTVLSNAFVMEEGRGEGYLFLPDSLQAGDYLLQAYTNTFTGERGAVPFRQALRVQGFRKPFRMKAELDTVQVHRDSVAYQAIIRTERGEPASGALVTWKLLADGKAIANGSSRLRPDGALRIPAVALRQVEGKQMSLETKLERGGEQMQSLVDLPATRTRVQIRFFPEGGNLVQGLPVRMGYRISTHDGVPVQMQAALQAGDGAPVLLETDARGFGSLDWIPSLSSYSVVARTQGYQLEGSLPAIQPSGYTLQAERGIVDDSLRLDFYASTSATGYLLVHNYKELVQVTPVHYQKEGSHFALASALLPHGLNTVTLFDSTGMPVAERTVFKEPASPVHITVKTDSARYANRSQVVLQLQAADASGEALPLSYSVAVVQAPRLDSLSFQHIRDYALLQPYIAAGLLPQQSAASLRGRALEVFLRTDCWTRYAWKDLVEAPAQKPSAQNTGWTGQVFRNGKPHRDSIGLVLVNGQGLFQVKAGADGRFEIAPELLVTEPDHKLDLMVAAKNGGEFTLRFDDANPAIQDSLAAIPFRWPRFSMVDPEGPAPVKAKVLDNVVIRSKNKLPEFAMATGKPVFSSKNCNDYVCMYNILNCINHRQGIPPQEGESYYMRDMGGSMITVTYKGCKEQASTAARTPKELLYRFRGRSLSKEFYVADYKQYNPQDPETLSTLYWNGHGTTDVNGKAEIRFYTNDLKGPFLIIVEGMSGGRTGSSIQTFTVGSK